MEYYAVGVGRERPGTPRARRRHDGRVRHGGDVLGGMRRRRRHGRQRRVRRRARDDAGSVRGQPHLVCRIGEKRPHDVAVAGHRARRDDGSEAPGHDTTEDAKEG
jgi:hypothetical protein